ncbi:MAG: hypothetical protein CMM25_05510 [Rhodospirillaceae bacterium]|nr:hypothetical protein [Rhodospirillaceae bacterium]|tara:strand:- start:494 stop:1048 length:555 start_codon:yes stop_codon:yes gene_type:complete
MANKLTTRDLIGSLIELQVDRDNQELMEPDNEASLIPIDKAIQEVKNQISRKTSGIDYMIVEMNKQTNLLDAEIATLMDEVKRLRGRKKSIKSSEDFFNKELLPMIIETAGNDGVFQTDTTRYKMYETWGPLEIIDEEAISDNYKRYKVEIDKKTARKAVIEAAEDGLGISGFKLEKVKRVRRS